MQTNHLSGVGCEGASSAPQGAGLRQARQESLAPWSSPTTSGCNLRNAEAERVLYTYEGEVYSAAMAAEFDASEFIDDDLHSARKKAQTAAGAEHAPSREDMESKVTEMQRKLADLKKAQQDLERERASLEELRRRQVEFTTGREEMLEHLTRGVGLLEEAEFGARREAEQMAQALTDLRDSLTKIQGIRDELWTKENLHIELTRALTVLENGRMEWNAARLKFPVLAAQGPLTPEGMALPTAPGGGLPGLQQLMQQQNYAEICKLGLALTWPLALVALAIFLVLLLR